MFAELGLVFLVLAIAVAGLQICWMLVGWRFNCYSASLDLAATRPGYADLAVKITPLVFGLVLISFGLLVAAFLADDFGVRYISQHSNSHMPWFYKISAAWGAHEGSLLLWALLLIGWSAMVSLRPGKLAELEHQRILLVLAVIYLSFLIFIAATSNPFERMPQALEDGLGLNPLLQDIALVLHPPMLYMGYVGLAVGFALAISQLWQAEVKTTSLLWARVWTLVAWVFLTLGIALGSWWAYYELGWGGWWFWDPVENASLLPWLVATAFLHTLLVAKQRQVLLGWTLLLAVLAFAMSLVGAFLVRSGVLTSVHAFANDPARGSFILIFLFVVIGSALALFSARAPQMFKPKPLAFVSKEAGLLFNNVLLMVITATILLGTLYPLIMDVFGLGKISVGEPYFNAVVLPLATPLVILMGLGFFIRWKQDKTNRIFKEISWLLLLVLLAVLLAAIWLAPNLQSLNSTDLILTLAGLTLGLWVGLSALYWALRHAYKTKKLSLKMLGAAVAHAGFGLFLLGMTVSSLVGIEKDVRLVPGESYQLDQYQIKFNGVEQTSGANYLTTQAKIELHQNQQKIADLLPEKRLYIGFAMPMTEVAIDASLARDIYIALGAPLDAEQFAWSFRLQYKPLVRAIWLGAILMALGGLLAAIGRRDSDNSRKDRAENE